MKTFKSILQFSKEFDTEEKCLAHLELSRWGNTPACPFCGSLNVHRHPSNVKFNCREKQCRKIFSAKVGTIYENSKLPLPKWYLATYILTTHSKGISSLQLATMLDITQKSAWFLTQRIREMLTENEPVMLKGEIQIDETYIGGKRTNKHAWEREKLKEKHGTGFGEKTPVVGLLEKGGKVVAFRIEKAEQAMLQPIVKGLVEKGSTIMTDGHAGYKGLNEHYNHVVINHEKGVYVVNGKHTNSLEGFWSLLKRQINGIHHSVSPKHINRYCNEMAYRYNNRESAQDDKFNDAVIKADGKRLRYKDLIAE